MIFTMIGGGAHRLLATTRSALKEGVFQKGGEIRLYDLDEKRSHDMALMIQKSPEYRACPVPVCYKLTLEQALEGADLVSITLLAGGGKVLAVESALGWSYGFLGSDNISYPGAFLALRDAPIVMNIAKKMEQYCPNAILLDFANPVSVVSAMVNTFTSIRCYGICEGHNNHGWDLTRILTGEDRYSPDMDVDVAGVNHLSWIIRGRWQGRDIFEMLNERIATQPDWWKKIGFTAEKPEFVRERMVDGMRKLVSLYQHQGALLFSTEGDGYSHFFHEEVVTEAEHVQWRHGSKEELLEAACMKKLEESSLQSAQERKNANLTFEQYTKMADDEIPWDSKMLHLFAVPDKGDVTVRILCGLAGVETTRVAVSHINNGAVSNIDGRFSLEFTHTVDQNGLHPVEGLKIPMGVYGMTASLAEHQTLLAIACGTSDPHDLYRALLAYPIGADTSAARELWGKLLTTSKDYIAPSFQEMRKFL